MATSSLLLGPILFDGFEVPSTIVFGGRQRIATHHYLNGRRSIDALGPDDATIVFSGVLSGGSAATRAHEIDVLRSLGNPLPLYWQTFAYLVVIQNFEARYEKPTWIPYRLSCAVLLNPISEIAQGAQSLVEQAVSALGQLSTTDAPVDLGIPDIRNSLSSHDPTYSFETEVGSLKASEEQCVALETQTNQHFSTQSLSNPVSTSDFVQSFRTTLSNADILQYCAGARNYLGQAANLLKNSSVV